MDLLNELFAFSCAQTPHRSFWLGREPLPVCHRCLGVYGGLLIGAIALAFKMRRCALAPGRLGRVGIASGIVAMIMMGLRWVDPNPEARFVGGFAFGASLAWLGLLAATSRPLAPPVREATPRETVCLLAVVTGASVAVLLVLRIDAVATHALLSGVALAGWGTALVLAGVTTVALARGRLPGLGARESMESG